MWQFDTVEFDIHNILRSIMVSNLIIVGCYHIQVGFDFAFEGKIGEAFKYSNKAIKRGIPCPL